MKIALLFIAFSCAAVAQQDMSVITGLVTDASGAAVQGARVLVTNRETGESRAAETTHAGAYTAGPLRIGRYDVAVGVIDVGNTGTGPIVNGGRSNTSAILFDGQDTRNNSTLDNAYTPPQEAVAEVRYITNSFSAEYGRSAGGVVVAAGRSGGNQLHGSAYDYLRNDKLNANSWANNRNT